MLRELELQIYNFRIYYTMNFVFTAKVTITALPLVLQNII